MQPYTKTNWVNDETLLSATNMNKIENQLETLTTNAINEAENIGDLEDLDTTDKSSLVNAINEVAEGGGSSEEQEIITIELEHEYEIEIDDSGTALIELDNEDLEVLEPYILDIINDEDKKDKLYKIKFSNEIWTLCAIESAIVDDENYSADILFSGECLTYVLQCDFSINISGDYTSDSFTFDIAEATLDMMAHMSDLFDKTGDLEDLETTDKSNLVSAINEVAGSGGSNSPIYEITLEHNASFWDENNGYSLNTNDKNSMASIINNAYGKGFRFINILINSSGSAEGITLYSTSDDRLKNNLQIKPTRLWLFGVSVLNRFINTGVPSIKAYQLTLSLSWNEDVASITSGTIYGSTKSFLPVNNTFSYSPTPNSYNPATTKYVDDSISSAVGSINTILATLTTPSNNGGGS